VRQRVAPVGERVQDEVGDAELAASAISALQVLERGVHAAVGDEPEQVHALGARERRAQHRLAASVPSATASSIRVRSCARRAGAEVEVTDLGVAHLAVGQPDRAPAGGQLGVRVGRPQLVEHRRARQRDALPGPARGASPQPSSTTRHAARRRGSVRGPGGDVIARRGDDRRERLGVERLAPPTSAPSTSGSASSSAALSGLTEPP
jgi:hypothetical protein